MISPQNRDEECFKWAIVTVDKWMDIDSHPERVSNLREFADNCDWSGLEFRVSLKQIGNFEAKNNISVNVLGLEGKDILHSQKFKSKRLLGILFVDDF